MATEDGQDPKVAVRYRELARPEPPRALDDAILAASRRAVGAKPADAAAPRTRPAPRWAVPVSVAAVLALSVLVTLRVEEERPVLEAPAPVVPHAPAPVVPHAPAPVVPHAPAPVVPQAPAPSREPVAPPAVAQAEGVPPTAAARNESVRAQAPPEAPRAAERRLADAAAPAFTPDPSPSTALAKSSAPAPAGAPASAPVAEAAPRVAPAESASPALGAASAPARTEMRQRGELTRDRESAARASAPASREDVAAGAPAPSAETPERQLERIAALRAEGRHDEADRLLAAFRERHPGYRIPEAMRLRVERR